MKEVSNGQHPGYSRRAATISKIASHPHPSSLSPHLSFLLPHLPSETRCLLLADQGWTSLKEQDRTLGSSGALKNLYQPIQQSGWLLTTLRLVSQARALEAVEPWFCSLLCNLWASQVALVVKNTPGNAGDTGLIPGSQRSPGGENGNPIQYSCLENPMDRGAWQGMVHRIAKNQTQLKQLSMHAHAHTHSEAPTTVFLGPELG